MNFPRENVLMSRIAAIMAWFFVAGFALAAQPEIKIGAKIDNLQVKDIRYLLRSLRDFGDKKAYVLVFVDTSCPMVPKYLPMLQKLERAHRDRAVQFLAVNSGPNDTITAMAAQAVEHGIEFPFV